MNEIDQKPGKKMSSGSWIGFGLAMGAGVGVVFHNVAIGASMGLLFGVMMDLFKSK